MRNFTEHDPRLVYTLGLSPCTHVSFHFLFTHHIIHDHATDSSLLEIASHHLSSRKSYITFVLSTACHNYTISVSAVIPIDYHGAYKTFSGC